jgi:UDPglucose 6-dehydrogenase
LARSAADAGLPSKMMAAVEAVNEEQKQVLVDKIVAQYGDDLRGRTFALWGLAFKPNTDDMREAPSRVIVAELIRRGATIQAYDPVAAAEARRVLALDLGDEALAQQLRFVSSAPLALAGADALVIVTEWKEFRTPDFDAMASTLADRRIFDGRNLYDPALVRSFGLDYRSIGRA